MLLECLGYLCGLNEQTGLTNVLSEQHMFVCKGFTYIIIGNDKHHEESQQGPLMANNVVEEASLIGW